ncbi:hypothetical protein ACFY12_32905 [Streptomyces sp. NPDC001339]|uniref:hypothetical protein n=1 Tax=Streptomyces sp. NPDC001339 TaxID=3364563 RepID=UPI0036BA3807
MPRAQTQAQAQAQVKDLLGTGVSEFTPAAVEWRRLWNLATVFRNATVTRIAYRGTGVP